MTQEIDLENREDLIKLLNSSAYKFIIIKFTATWCRPCKVIQPFLEKMVDEKIEKLNAQQKKNHFPPLRLPNRFATCSGKSSKFVEVGIVIVKSFIIPLANARIVIS